MYSPRLFYSIALWLLLPYALLHLWWRARKQPEYLAHVGERFGRYATTCDKPVIWLHTVSVGETRAAATLVQNLQVRFPDHQILLTHTTPTGRAASEQLYGDDVMRAYLPYDYPFAMRRFLRHFRPRLGVLMETEIWPNLIHQCQQAKIPLLLLNARLSERSARRYARFPRLTRSCLQELHLIAAQTDDDAMRLGVLGHRSVSVMGNLKFDISPPAAMQALGLRLRTLFGTQRPVFLAASTREGEEQRLLEALRNVDIAHLLTVIVPRHPQRFDEVANLIRQRGYCMQRRSDDKPIASDTEIILGDSMGELFAYYTACDIAFIGGSLLPLGGQNLIEACAAGKPVLVGPHTFNFAQATEQAIACGAALRIHNADDLVQHLRNLLLNPEHMKLMGKSGERFVSDNQGATDRASDLIARVLQYNP